MIDSYAQLETFLAGAGASVGASDLHGSLTGYLCGGGKTINGRWLEALELDVEDADKRRRVEQRLHDMERECRAALGDPQMGFEPLLPESDRPVGERADALVEWCRGFLGGFGLAHGAGGDELSADGSEVLRDFGTIAASDLSAGDGEDDERALMEVSEFVRVGTLILHAEVAGGPPANAAPGATVH